MSKSGAMLKLYDLHEIADIIAGQSPESTTYNSEGNGLPFFQGKADFQEKNPRVRVWCTSKKRKESLPGDILMSVRAPVGSVNICDQRSVIGRGLSAIRPKKAAYGDYLYFFLKANEKQIDALGTGSTFKAITQETLKAIKIPLPPLDDQKRIAHLLGKVEGSIAQRKKHLQQLDVLLKSVFLEMFGDPVKNEKGWDVHPCEKAVLDISSGTSYGGEDRDFSTPDEVGVLKISAVTKGAFDSSEFKIVNQAHITKTLRYVKRGDFLFSRANTVELVAACCVVPRDFPRLFLPDKLWVLQFNEDLISALFFNYLLKNERYRDVVRSLASGGHDSMLNISMKKFMTLDVPCPPLPLQNQFAAIVEKVEHLKTRYQQTLADLESLYGTLSQNAFAGELDLSRVELPIVEEKFMHFDAPEHRASATPAFVLPPTPEGTDLGDKVQRQALIKEWLDAYFQQIESGNELPISEFINTANIALQSQEDVPAWGLADQDQLRSWIFNNLELGNLLQSFKTESAKKTSQTIVLKKRDS